MPKKATGSNLLHVGRWLSIAAIAAASSDLADELRIFAKDNSKGNDFDIALDTTRRGADTQLSAALTVSITEANRLAEKHSDAVLALVPAADEVKLKVDAFKTGTGSGVRKGGSLESQASADYGRTG